MEYQRTIKTQDGVTDVAELTKKLVSIPSVNPMGRDLDSSITEEIRLTDFLESFFTGLGIPC